MSAKVSNVASSSTEIHARSDSAAFFSSVDEPARMQKKRPRGPSSWRYGIGCVASSSIMPAARCGASASSKIALAAASVFSGRGSSHTFGGAPGSCVLRWTGAVDLRAWMAPRRAR